MYSLAKIEKDKISNPSEIPLLDHMECFIDNMIPLDPTMCSKCQTVFCKNCITEWISNSNKCPMRCEPPNLLPLKDSIFKTQFNRILLRCAFEKFGCKSVFNINQIMQHQKHCQYRSIQCLKCNNEIAMINNMSHLLNECEENKYECFICGEKFNLGKMVQHVNLCLALNENLNIKKIEICENCGLRFNDKEKHFCLNRKGVKEVNKIVDWVKGVKEYEEYIRNYCQELRMKVKKENKGREKVMKEITSGIKDKSSAVRKRKEENRGKELRRALEESFNCINKGIDIDRKQKDFEDIITHIKLKNIELMKSYIKLKDEELK